MNLTSVITTPMPPAPRRATFVPEPARYDCGTHGTLTVKEIAEKAGINKSTVYWRLEHGWTGELLVLGFQHNTSATAKRYDCGPAVGMLTIREIRERNGVTLATMQRRLNGGWKGAALLQPAMKRETGMPRNSTLVRACRLGVLVSDLGRLPTKAEIRKACPMSKPSAERWLCALRLATEGMEL